MLVLSSSLVLSAEEEAYPDNTPLIGYQNLVTFTNITADTEATGYPATNLSNPATNQEWRADDTTAQELSFAVASVEDVDYVGIARHNFGSEGISVEVGYYKPLSPTEWESLAGPAIPPDDGPLLFQFTPQSLQDVVIKLGSGSAEARMAVVYIGKLLIMPRSLIIDSDFPAPKFARKTSVVHGRAESGDYLGRVVLGQHTEWQHSYAHLDPEWYRDDFDPFIREALDDTPFFYAWSPDDYPYEVAYSWLIEDPVPLTNPVTGRKAVSIKCGGIVE